MDSHGYVWSPEDTQYGHLTPEDPLTNLPLNQDLKDMLAAQFIFTIRHFAQCNISELMLFSHDSWVVSNIHAVAKQIVAFSLPTKKRDDSAEVWGYVYVSEDFYEYTKKEKELKSSYVLFNDYTNSPLEKKLVHPWVQIYHTYAKEAANWCHHVSEPTDLDVYSYLIWRAIPSFAELDYTAGPRAIYFNWWCLRPDAHKYCITVDKMLAGQLNDPLLEHRNDRCLQINLTAIVKHCQGAAKIFRIEPNQAPNDPKKWIPTTLAEAKNRADDVNRNICQITPGDSFYSSNFAHGCIVTPTGTIPGDFISVSDKIEL